MSRSALGTTFSFLLLVSIIQGFQDVELLPYKKEEAVVGQHVILPCIVKNLTDLKIISTEWSKKNDASTKLALYNLVFGEHLFWPNVTIKIERDNASEMMGSYLHLPGVKKWDSGIYICDITTFPLGSIRTETKLTIKDDDSIICDVHSAVEVHNGENVTINCKAFPNAQYRWTKNKTVLSENESLKLWWVTDANAGVYTLTVNMGNKRLRKEFIVTVLSATTSLRTDLVTASPQGLAKTTDSNLSTSPTHVNWTTSINTNYPSTSNVTITAVEYVTSSTNLSYINVTSSPATYSDTNHLINSTTSSYSSTELRSTQERTRTEFKPHTPQPEDIFTTRPEEYSTSGNSKEISKNPDAPPTLSARSTPPVTKDEDTVQSHLLLVLIIVPVVLLIVVAGLLCRRQIIKNRMDLPPPFKPPPPPVKYTAGRHSGTQSFPISRCNSFA